MNNIYLLNDVEYNDIFKNKSYSFKKEILISNFNILISKILGQLKIIIKPYKKDAITVIDNLEKKLKLIKFVDNNFLFNKLYGLVLEYQNLFENDINKYLNKEETLFNTVYNIILGITNNKNLLEKIKRFLKEYKDKFDPELYNFIIKFIKKDILDKIILLVKFIKKKLLKTINEDKLTNFLKKVNLIVIFKINKLLIYIITKIANIEGYLVPSENIKNLRDIDKINIKVCLSFIKIIAEEINKEIIKYIKLYIKKNIKKLKNIDNEENESSENESSDEEHTNTKNILDLNINIESDFIYILKYKKKEIHIDDESLKYVLNYQNIVSIYKQIDWKGDLKNILEIENLKHILMIIKNYGKKEFNIEADVIDMYLSNLFTTYLDKDKIYGVFNSNSDNFTELFNYTKYLFKITNKYFKLELEK